VVWVKRPTPWKSANSKPIKQTPSEKRREDAVARDRKKKQSTFLEPRRLRKAEATGTVPGG